MTESAVTSMPTSRGHQCRCLVVAGQPHGPQTELAELAMPPLRSA